MHRPRSNSSLNLGIENKYQIRTGKKNASAQRLLSATLLAASSEPWLQVCRVKITFESLLNNLFKSRFHKNEFDEMLCKVDHSNEYARSFEQTPTLP